MGGQEFGGIEVSQGSGVTEVPKLTASNLTGQVSGLPLVWIDGKTTNDGWVTLDPVQSEVVLTEKNQLWFGETKTVTSNGNGLVNISFMSGTTQILVHSGGNVIVGTEVTLEIVYDHE